MKKNSQLCRYERYDNIVFIKLNYTVMKNKNMKSLEDQRSEE